MDITTPLDDPSLFCVHREVRAQMIAIVQINSYSKGRGIFYFPFLMLPFASSRQARFWVQVMRDLREGVKLKKVQERQYNPLPIEYQLTPYEMLMDDIRSKRYKLRKVMVSVRVGPHREMNATCTPPACCTYCFNPMGNRLEKLATLLRNNCRLG